MIDAVVVVVVAVVAAVVAAVVFVIGEAANDALLLSCQDFASHISTQSAQHGV